MKTQRDSCCRAADGGGAPSSTSSCGRLQGHHSGGSVDPMENMTITERLPLPPVTGCAAANCALFVAEVSAPPWSRAVSSEATTSPNPKFPSAQLVCIRWQGLQHAFASMHMH